MRWLRVLMAVALMAAVVASAGCDSGGVPNGSDENASPTAGSAGTEPAAGSSRAIAVSEDLLEAIASGEESGVGMRPVRGVAVKSEDFSNVYMVAMEFSATGIENQVGVWSTNSLTPGGGIIMAVDGTAKAFTVWPDADQTDAAITIADDGVAEAKAALQGQ